MWKQLITCGIVIALVLALGGGCSFSHNHLSSAQEGYIESYVKAHNEMVEAEGCHNKAVDYIHAQMYSEAVEELSEAKQHAVWSLLAVGDMMKYCRDFEDESSKECRITVPMMLRASSFSSAMDHYINSIGHIKKSHVDIPAYSDPVSFILSLSSEILESDYNLKRANEEIKAGNEDLTKSWDYIDEVIEFRDEIPLLEEYTE